jgi:PTH1 family peptidyl-tRNA hydrolase
VKLIFALGNPGSEYTGTRHNTGFMAIDAWANHMDASFAEKAKFHAYIAEILTAKDKILLVKPTTFYNNAGEAARSLIDFYKLSPANDLLVIHDDLALPLGTIRIRKNGTDAGNNGIKSLNDHIGPDYARLRIGVHTDERTDDVSFVLGRFKSSEVEMIKKEIIPKTGELISDFIAEKLEETSYSMRPSPQ